MGIPIFEIETRTESIKIYANGVVEGLNDYRVVNCIPAAIHKKFIDYFSKKYDNLKKEVRKEIK
jgi:hypothetical protein